MPKRAPQGGADSAREDRVGIRLDDPPPVAFRLDSIKDRGIIPAAYRRSGVSVNGKGPHGQATPGYAQKIARNIRAVVIVLGALTGLVVAIIGFWDPLEELICDKASLCSGASNANVTSEPPPPDTTPCDPDDIETCIEEDLR